MARLIYVITVLSVFNFIESARILGVFPTPSISHQVVFRPLIQALVKRGHEIVVITPDPAFPKGKAPANLTEIDVHDISYAYADKLLTSRRGNKADAGPQFRAVLEVMPLIFEKQLQVPEIQRILKEERNAFDLMIVESCVRAALGLSHIINAPMIQISSLGVAAPQYALAGAPIQPFLYPTPMHLRLYNLSFYDKIWEVFSLVNMVINIYGTQHHDYALARKYFGQDVPKFETLFSNVKMLFINEHPLWAGNRPVPPNIVYIGGIHQNAEKPLPNDLKSYLDSSKHGVIYISFGTNVKSSMLAADKIKVMIEVLSTLPYDVLWKWDGELPGASENIKTSRWLPQSDLLRHPKLKLFITQGGLQSTDEALNAGVPVIGIPMLADQWYNVEKYVHHKMGLQLDFPTLTKEDFGNAVTTVINDTSFKENTIRLRQLMREYPIQPLDNAVWWTEHILRHGGDHLQPPTFGMYGFLEYYELPLVLMLITILVTVLSVILFLVNKLRNIVKIRVNVKKHVD